MEAPLTVREPKQALWTYSSSQLYSSFMLRRWQTGDFGIDSGDRQPGSVSLFYCLLAGEPWVSYSTSPCLSFLVWEMGKIIASTLRVVGGLELYMESVEPHTQWALSPCLLSSCCYHSACSHWNSLAEATLTWGHCPTGVNSLYSCCKWRGAWVVCIRQFLEEIRIFLYNIYSIIKRALPLDCTLWEKLCAITALFLNLNAG